MSSRPSNSNINSSGSLQYNDLLSSAVNPRHEPEIIVPAYDGQEKTKIIANISKATENEKAESVAKPDIVVPPINDQEKKKNVATINNENKNDKAESVAKAEIHVDGYIVEEKKKGDAKNTSEEFSNVKAHAVEPELVAAKYASLAKEYSCKSDVQDYSHQTGGQGVCKDERKVRNQVGSRRQQVGGAAVLGGVAGLVVGGPLTAVVGAGGAAALASSHGEAGDLARKYGGKVAKAGSKLRKSLSQEHIAATNPTNKSRNAANGDEEVLKSSTGENKTRESGNFMTQASYKVRKFDEKHQLVAKASERIKKFDEKHKVVAQASERFNKFDEKHHVVEKATKSFHNGCKWVSKSLNSTASQGKETTVA